ncbi:MAG: class I SAM-dependent methyltransferase [Anaerolineae bacterium]|nr:class I SAM-dependent methyltransferase [Anaerolineae bacterium]
MTVGKAFDESVAYYDGWIKTALPGYASLFAAALDVIPFETSAALEILDLGAGTGLFAEYVLAKYKRARFTLMDMAPKMLALAEKRFEANREQFEFVEQDFRQFDAQQRFDVVISSMAIHHLTSGEKQHLFAAVFHSLRAGGVFINLDQIKAPSPELQQFYWDHWLAHVRAQNAAEEQIQASIQRRLEFDKDDTLHDQLKWLAEAGFPSVDCVFKNFFVGVFYARK